jgi:hypothetical protein
VNSCQIPYEAEIEEKIGLISIEGSIVKGDSTQTIIITRSTSLYTPEFDPVLDCAVSVEDDAGNEFTFQELERGIYKSVIPDEFLVFERKYKLIIRTPEGEQYESSYEVLNQSALVDSVYHERKNLYVASRDKELDGVHFYLDLMGSESDSRYYRWVLTETWEYISTSYINYYYANDSFNIEYPETPFEFFYCWRSMKIKGLYSSSTVNLTSNMKKKIPLHFVSNQTNRLSVEYSLLVEQYSLNAGAYNYWNQTKVETHESGGLHTQQPGQTRSNLFNINDNDEEVLGYFWASSKTKKRIFISRPPMMTFNNPECDLELIDYEVDLTFPIFIIADPFGNEYTTNSECLNCLLLGGDNKEPDYWE